MKKIRFAIVGMGHIGKKHARMILENPYAELVAIIDNDFARIKQIKEEYNLPVYAEFKDFTRQTEELADVINICTPNYIHTEIALEALQDEYHVVIEKPMGLNARKCKDVIALSEKKSKHVFCVMQNRYSPPSRLLKELIDSKKLGDIYHVEIGCYWNRDQRYYQNSSWRGKLNTDGGTLFTQFSHFVDTLYWLFGDIAVTSAVMHNNNHPDTTEFEDSGTVTFDIIEGGHGSINFSTSVWDKNMESSITIIGELGSIKVGGQYMDKIEYCHIKDYTLPELDNISPPNDYGHYQGSASNHKYVIQNVIDKLNNGENITTNAFEGMKVVELIEAIYEKAGNRRK